MPLHWERREKAPAEPGAFSFAAGGTPLARLMLWPHRSLPRKGFALFIALTFGMILVPLIAVIGTVVLWGLLPFMLGALALVWWALERSYADGTLREELTLWSDRVELRRMNPRGPEQSWEANPYWVRVEMHAEGGPVSNYLTLTGGGRSVEIGAFLSPEEREALREDLNGALAEAARAASRSHDPC